MTEFSAFHFPILIFFSPFPFFLTPIPALLPIFTFLFSNLPHFSLFFTFLFSNTSHFPALPPSLYSNALHSAPFFFSYIPIHPTSFRFSFLFTPTPRFSSFFTFLCSNLSHFPTPSPNLYSNASHSTPLFFSNIPIHPTSSRFSFLFTPTYPISLHHLLLSIPIRLIPHHFSSPLFSSNILYSTPFLPSFSFSSKPNHAPKLRKYIFPQNPKPENPFILSKSSHTSAPPKKETLTSSKSKNNLSPQLKISAYSIFSSSLSHSLFSIKQKKDKSFRIYPFLYPLY